MFIPFVQQIQINKELVMEREAKFVCIVLSAGESNFVALAALCRAGVGNCFGSGATLWKRRLAEGRTF
jgi:hypothetical protein